MKTVEIRSETELHRLRDDWDALLQQSHSRTIFLTWEWMAAWWAAYGAPGEMRLLAVYDDAGVLRGIAPLRSGAVRRYGRTFASLSFVGDGSFDSDYLDFIAAAGFEKQVVDALGEYHRGRTNAILLLNEVPATSPNIPPLRELAQSKRMEWCESDAPCATVPLPGTWDEYLRMLQPRFRSKIRSVLKGLEGRPEVKFGFCESAGELERLLPSLFDLHTRRWAVRGKPGVFGWDRKRKFYFEVSRLLLERGWLRLSWLEWNGQPLACQYGFVYDGVYSQLQEGYEPFSEHLNPGIALRAWSIREFLKEGLREYDFLGGDGNRHKTDWGAVVKSSKRIVLAHGSVANTLFCRGPRWEEAARESVKRFIPEPVLRLRERSAEGGRGGGREWLRKAAASCYVHSGLPIVARRLRESYQLSIGGAGRKVSWRRRAEASARILYYHRVNDDADPFFEAISTDLFEAHVRYVARHYKVLSIGGILRHLEEGGSPETVVGITFDDGYADNYQNAFPVLQRYGLPATIFLTTGAIDSGAPLWFERLAAAVKKTSREFVDLEFDIPRRFWMRTQAERVESNGSLFALLRPLDDAERNRRLAEILRELGGAPEDERRNKMLTWDQIRLMQANGIDFGGHTVTHPFLSRLAPADAAREVSECKRRIEEEIQRPADFFAYPNGRDGDFGEITKELVRTAGYRGAVTTLWGMNYRSTDRMELRRGGPWESTAAQFAYKLDWYQLANE